MEKHSEVEYNQITDQIFIGTNMCCQIHFDEELLKKGITADISLEKGKVDSPHGVDFYVWIPVEDNEAPKIEQAEFFIATLDKWIDMGVKIYAHCRNGHGRAPTMVAAYFISKGMNAEEAIAKLKEKRPTTHLSEQQLVFLKEFEEKFI